MKVRRQPTGTFDHRALKRALMNFDNGSSMVHQWWRELDSNQRRHSQRIYSPPLLTAQASLHGMTSIETIGY